MNNLTTVNIELTSICNKNCWMCGRRKMDRDYPKLKAKYGHMDFALLKKIARQLPDGIVVQLHNNGEPTVYPHLGEALQLFKGKIRCFNTNAKLIVRKAVEIIGKMEVLTISIVQDDHEADLQYETVKRFLQLKGTKPPRLVYRHLGNVDVKRWEKLPGITVTRILHNPDGSFDYKKKVTIPEIGICLDMLHHLAINKDGDVSICVRFDPGRKGVIGNIRDNTLEEIWNGKKHKKWLEHHINGQRNKVPLCEKCEFWGVPTGM